MLLNKQQKVFDHSVKHNTRYDTISIGPLDSVSEEDFISDYAEKYILDSSSSSHWWKYLLEENSHAFIDYLENEADYSSEQYIYYLNSIKFYLSALFVNANEGKASSQIYIAAYKIKNKNSTIKRFLLEYLIMCGTDTQTIKSNISVVLRDFPDIFERSEILETVGDYLTEASFNFCVDTYQKEASKILEAIIKEQEKTIMEYDKDEDIYKMIKKFTDEHGLVFKKNGDVMTKYKTKSPESVATETPIFRANNIQEINTMTTKLSPTVNTISSGEVMLGKTSRVQDTIDVTVDVHKESIKAAATIEAGNIALTFLTERLKNVLPPQAQLFLYLPGSEIMIATVATIGIHTFAPDNPKAMIAAKAMTTAAYGKLFAKINVSKLIEDVIDKIPTDMLSNILLSKD